MIAQLHNQNRATIRALWRFTEKQLESERFNGVYSVRKSWILEIKQIVIPRKSDEMKKSFVKRAIKACRTESDKISTLSLILSNGKCIFDVQSQSKIASEVYNYVIESTLDSFKDSDNLSEVANLLKLLNQLMTKEYGFLNLYFCVPTFYGFSTVSRVIEGILSYITK